MSYWLHEEAETELGDAAALYAEHATPKIAIALLAEFESVIGRRYFTPMQFA